MAKIHKHQAPNPSAAYTEIDGFRPMTLGIDGAGTPCVWGAQRDLTSRASWAHVPPVQFRIVLTGGEITDHERIIDTANDEGHILHLVVPVRCLP